MNKKDVKKVILGKNPFLNDFKIPIRRINKKEYDVDGNPKYGSYDMELQTSCKLYVDKDFRKNLYLLKGASFSIQIKSLFPRPGALVFNPNQLH